MKSWLRLTIITMTVGGGFTGMAITLQAIFTSSGQNALSLSLMCLFFVAFGFVTASGLIFVHDPRRTGPLIGAIAIQVPSISSPIFVYSFATGANLTIIFGNSTTFNAGIFRSSFSMFLFQNHSWQIGINVFALAILVLLAQQPKIDPPVPSYLLRTPDLP